MVKKDLSKKKTDRNIYIIHNSNLVGPTIYLNSQKLEFFDH